MSICIIALICIECKLASNQIYSINLNLIYDKFGNSYYTGLVHIKNCFVFKCNDNIYNQI